MHLNLLNRDYFMYVFYEGWGCWRYNSDELQQVVSEEHIYMDCCILKLPKNEAKKINYLGEAEVSYLLLSNDPDIKEPLHTYPTTDDNPQFVLCEDVSRYENGLFVHYRAKPIKYTKKDTLETSVATEQIEESKIDIGTVQRPTDSKLRKNREDNLTKAIKAAIQEIGKKPRSDELWQYFQDEKDETGHIVDYKETHITWIDTRGVLHDIPKRSFANRLSRIKI